MLKFTADGASSQFRLGDKRSLWSEFSVLDPTREGAESLELAPRLPPATQVLLSYELRRAHQRLQRMPKDSEASFGESRQLLSEIFEPLAEGTYSLPSHAVQGIPVLLLWSEEETGVCEVHLGILDRIVPRPGWSAPFLHRTDDRSELHARLHDVDERTGRCHRRKKNSALILCPCHFICTVVLEKDGSHGRNMRLDQEGLERFVSTKQYLKELRLRQEAKGEDVSPTSPGGVEATTESVEDESPVGDLVALPSGRLTTARCAARAWRCPALVAGG